MGVVPTSDPEGLTPICELCGVALCWIYLSTIIQRIKLFGIIGSVRLVSLNTESGRNVTNYQIIVDEQAVKDFIDLLPDNTTDEQYYFCLFARKKYCKDIKYIKSDKSQPARKTATKDRIFQKIKQMECALGSYVQYGKPGEIETIDIPQEALALYINPNPRSLKKATIQCLQRLANVLGQESPNFNVQAEAMSCIQKCKSRQVWVDFDIDTKEEGTLETVHSILQSRDCYKVLETRGGYHVLVETKKVPDTCDRMWYKHLKALADINGDCMLPVPGTYQGGFVPRFI